MEHLSNDRRVWADIEGHCVKTLLLGRPLIMRFCTGRCSRSLCSNLRWFTCLFLLACSFVGNSLQGRADGHSQS